MILRSEAIEFCKDSMGDQSLPVGRILSAYHQWLESTGHEIVSTHPVRRGDQSLVERLVAQLDERLGAHHGWWVEGSTIMEGCEECGIGPVAMLDDKALAQQIVELREAANLLVGAVKATGKG